MIIDEIPSNYTLGVDNYTWIYGSIFCKNDTYYGLNYREIAVSLNGTEYSTHTGTWGIFMLNVELPKHPGQYTIYVKHNDILMEELEITIQEPVNSSNYPMLPFTLIIAFIIIFVIALVKRKNNDFDRSDHSVGEAEGPSQEKKGGP